MSSGNWLNNDTLFLQYGTAKATSETGGEYKSYGANRVTEFLITGSGLSASSSSPTFLSYTDIFPSGTDIMIEKVELLAEAPISQTGTTLSVGFMNLDQKTLPSSTASTAIVNAISTASLSTQGVLVTLATGSTAAGNAIGLFSATSWTSPVYFTAFVNTAISTGSIKTRVYWHGVGTIVN